ncbi:MAG: TetR/AcrR family transcriptional regulator [Deltaproteobacteria bacterium]|nr:TetR/AcrR family transcriptional regulator [Deltaproteobacteria bacterium]
MLSKENILAFASNLFWRYGPKKTTMDDVARTCRIGKATLYKFFKNKDELYKEILRDEMNKIFCEIESRLKDLKGVREKLRMLFETEYFFFKGNINLSEVLVGTVEDYDRDIKSITDEFYDRQRKLIKSILHEGVLKKEIIVEDVSLLSLAMMAAGQGLFGYFKHLSDERKAIKSIRYLIDTLFFGIEAGKGSI